MIHYTVGDLFESPAQTLVNPVNCVGIMGRGLSAEFRRRFPDMFEQYRALCVRGHFAPGVLWQYKAPNKCVLCFPTKIHWRNPSRVRYIASGLQTFVHNYEDWKICSVAFPALGCGHGLLDFADQVRPLMTRYLGELPIDVFIYLPHERAYEPGLPF